MKSKFVSSMLPCGSSQRLPFTNEGTDLRVYNVPRGPRLKGGYPKNTDTAFHYQRPYNTGEHFNIINLFTVRFNCPSISIHVGGQRC